MGDGWKGLPGRLGSSARLEMETLYHRAPPRLRATPAADPEPGYTASTPCGPAMSRGQAYRPRRHLVAPWEPADPRSYPPPSGAPFPR